MLYIIEGDCAKVVDWCSLGPPWSLANYLINDIKQFSLSFEANFRCVRRSANGVTHFIAKSFNRVSVSSGAGLSFEPCDQIRSLYLLDYSM